GRPGRRANTGACPPARPNRRGSSWIWVLASSVMGPTSSWSRTPWRKSSVALLHSASPSTTGCEGCAVDSPSHKVLIIGAGSIGERHLRCFQATGRAKLSLVEIDTAKRRTVAERYGISDVFNEVEAALAARPDVAVIATPAPSHVPLAIRLGEAGVHMLIEKPLGTTLEGIGRLQE